MEVKVTKVDDGNPGLLHYHYTCPEDGGLLGMFYADKLGCGATFSFRCNLCGAVQFVVLSVLKAKTEDCEFVDGVGTIEL